MMSDSAELLTIEQAAQFLSVSETSLRRWTNRGLLPCLRVGGRRERRFRREDLLAFLEQQGAAGDGDADPLRQVQVGKIPMSLGTHVCGLYGSDLAGVKQAASFLAGGLHPGSAAFLAAEANVRDAVMAHLRAAVPPLRDVMAAGRLVVSRYTTSARAQLEYWETQLITATKRGAKALRVVGDVSGLARHVSKQELIEYEESYDELIARRFPVVTLCQYDVRTFSSVALLNALKGHPDTFRYPAKTHLG